MVKTIPYPPSAGDAEQPMQFAGWIAFYKGKKFEIRKSSGIYSLYGAKRHAIKHFKVPRSKEGLMAIEPAYEEIPDEDIS